MNRCIFALCLWASRVLAPAFTILVLAVLVALVSPLRAQLVADGATSTLSNVMNTFTGDVTVGTNGAFTQLVLSDDALLTNSLNGVIGRNLTAKSNEVQLISATARWRMGGTLFVGSNGAASRILINNGALVENNNGTLGFRLESSNNLALVTGNGSMWSNRNNLDIGSIGRGNEMIVSNGGWVASRNVRVGVDVSSSNNLVLVTGGGSVWSNVLGLTVGNTGPGNRLVVEAGGLVNDDTGTVGDFGSASNNEALVTGPGSLWLNRSTLTIGNQIGRNRLVVSNGASVWSGSGAVSTFSNQVVVTGAGSVWSNQNSLVLAGGSNRVDVSGGGWLADVTGDITGTSNTIMLTGNGSGWNNSDSLLLGDFGNGHTLVASNGATVVSSNAMIGASTSLGNNNFALLTAVGTLWSNRNNFTVGNFSFGNRLVVSNSAAVITSNLFVGFQSSASSNRVTVDGGTLRANVLDVRRGAATLNAGLMDVDFLRLTNTQGQFEFNGGRLVTRGAAQNNSVAMNIGASGGGGGVWDVRAGASNHVVALGVVVGNLSPFNQLLITDGALLTNGGGGFIGAGAGGNSNVVTVEGPGSQWQTAGDFTVGSSGSFNRLAVSNAGWVVNASGLLGAAAGANNNEALVIGPGAAWSNRADVIVGQSGSGNQLLVGDGGAVFAAGNGLIGQSASANANTVFVSDPGSQWRVAGSLRVGIGGSLNGLVVTDGALVTDTDGFVGNGATGSNNVAMVTGPGSLWSNLNSIAVGARSQLVVSNGGAVLASVSQLGGSSPSNQAVVTGSGSVWSTAFDLTVGDVGSANQLMVKNGGLLVNGLGSIGVSSPSNEVIIAGSGSLWSNRLDLSVGVNGPGNQLIVSDGGTAFTGGNGVIGGTTTAVSNSVLVTDAGSRWLIATNLFVGSNAPFNRLVVSSGAMVYSPNGLIGARQASSNNLVIVTGAGSLWTNGFFTFASAGNQLVVSNGGSVTMRAGGLGSQGGAGSNQVVVTGPGSILRCDGVVGGFEIGNNSSGNRLVVTSAGRVVSQIGSLDRSNEVIVTGAGSLWSNRASLVLDGPSRLQIENGGTVAGQPVLVGQSSTNTRVVVNGGTLLVSAPDGTGMMDLQRGTNVLNAGLVDVDHLLLTNTLGFFEFKGGTLVTRGAFIDNARPFIVGGPPGFGAVPAVWDVRAGLDSHHLADSVLVGSNSPFNQLLINTGAVISADHSFIVGHNPTTSTNNLLHVVGGTLRAVNSGTGVLDIRGGTNRLDAGLVDLDRLIITNARGQFELNGGTLRTPNTFVANGRVFTVGGSASVATLQLFGGTHSFSNNLIVANNGSLIGNGIVDGTVTVAAGGKLTPGAPIGRISVLGTVILQGAVNLQIDKSGANLTNDQVTASGAIFYSGTLNVTDIGTDDLAAGDRFPLFSATPYVGGFTTISLPPLNPGLSWANNLLVDGSIEVVAASMPGFASIRLSGTNVVISGTSGVPNGTYHMLTSTNVALPLSNWVSIATNQFDGSGKFAFSNAVSPAIPRRFFQLRSP